MVFGGWRPAKALLAGRVSGCFAFVVLLCLLCSRHSAVTDSSGWIYLSGQSLRPLPRRLSRATAATPDSPGEDPRVTQARASLEAAKQKLEELKRGEDPRMTQARASLEVAMQKLEDLKRGKSAADGISGMTEAISQKENVGAGYEEELGLETDEDSTEGTMVGRYEKALGLRIGEEEPVRPAELIVASAVFRRAAVVLFCLLRSPEGAMAVDALARRTCAALERGSWADFGEVIGSSTTWEQAGIDSEEALNALYDFGELVTPRQGSPPMTAAAAVLDVVQFDQMPDRFKSLVKLYDLEDETDFNFVDQGAEGLFSDPGVREAARFAARLELIPSEANGMRERFRRLGAMPMLQEVASLVEADPALVELSGALEPHAEDLYKATRKAQARAFPPREIAFNAITINQDVVVTVILGLAVAAVASYFVFFNKPDSGQLPLYASQEQQLQSR